MNTATCATKVADLIEEPCLLDNRDLSQISSRAALDEGNVSSQTHPVDVIPGRSVVQSIHDKLEISEEFHVVILVHDAVMVSSDVRRRAKPKHTLLGNLKHANN